MKADAALAAAEANVERARREAAQMVARAAIDQKRSLRRKRAACSLSMLASLSVVIGGSIAAIFGASWLIPGFAAAVFVAAFAGIVSLAKVKVAAPAVETQAAEPVQAHPAFVPVEFEQEEAAATPWTPQPLPKPLHLSKGTIAAMAMASVDAANELKRAAAEKTRDERAAELAPRVTPLPARAVPAAQAPTASARASAPAEPTPAARATAERSRFAQMGIVAPTDENQLNLDEVLRRRRVAG